MCTEEEVESTLVAELCLQQPRVDVTELEDARWFHHSWLSRHLTPAGASIHPILPSLTVFKNLTDHLSDPTGHNILTDSGHSAL